VNRRYNDRLYGLLRDFVARFSDMDAIYRQTIAAARRQVQPTLWKQCWSKFCGRFSSESSRILTFMNSLDENQVIDVTFNALGGMLAAHRRFKERHQLNGAAATVCQRFRIKERRQLKGASPAAARQNETLVLHADDNQQNILAASTTAAVSAHLSHLMGQSVSQVCSDDTRGMRSVQRTFKERHQQTGAVSAELRHNEALPAVSVDNPQRIHVNSSPAVASTANCNDQMCEALPVSDVEHMGTVDMIVTGCAVDIQWHQHDLEKVVVQAAGVRPSFSFPSADAPNMPRSLACRQKQKGKSAKLELEEVVVQAFSPPSAKEHANCRTQVDDTA
jgi:hypothetical protein